MRVETEHLIVANFKILPVITTQWLELSKSRRYDASDVIVSESALSTENRVFVEGVRGRLDKSIIDRQYHGAILLATQQLAIVGPQLAAVRNELYHGRARAQLVLAGTRYYQEMATDLEDQSLQLSIAADLMQADISLDTVTTRWREIAGHFTDAGMKRIGGVVLKKIMGQEVIVLGSEQLVFAHERVAATEERILRVIK